VITTIPFSGFYNSIHDSELDCTLPLMFTDDSGNSYDGVVMRAYNACDWGAVHRAYAAEYCSAFAHEYKLALSFESLQSPREYNFTTDRIFATIEESEARRILAATAPDVLAAVAKESFTSRDGFCSFYSPDVADWGDVSNWDHNQLGAMIAAYVAQQCDSRDGFDQWAEFALMESAQGNGRIDAMLDNAIDGVERLYRVCDYLRRRGAR